MPHFMFQASYTAEAWKNLVGNPQDRGKEMAKLVKAFGGEMQTAFITFGDYDIMLVAELPDEATAMALAMAAASAGAATAVKTTVMVPTDAAVNVLKLAGKVAQKYKAPAAKRRRPVRRKK